MKTERVAVETIRVRERVREDLGDIETLKNSLREYGLLNPVLVDESYNLIAGERRLEAARALGWAQIDVRVMDGMSRVALFDMEVHENLLRKEFTEREVAKSIEQKKLLLNPPWIARFKAWWSRLFRVFSARLSKKVRD